MKYIDEFEHDGICVKIYKDNGVYILHTYVDGVYNPKADYRTDMFDDALKMADFMVHGGEL